MANWNFGRPSFDPLRKVIQGQTFLGRLLTPGRVRHKNVSVLWCRQHGETGIPVLFWFQLITSASTSVPAHCHWLSDLMFQWTILDAQNWPKKYWPWMTFLSRSNKGRRFFQFATEEFKCRPLIYWKLCHPIVKLVRRYKVREALNVYFDQYFLISSYWFLYHFCLFYPGTCVISRHMNMFLHENYSIEC